MKVLDPGHRYQLETLDGDVNVTITFVKRDNPPEQYPGNVGSYPGTNLQEVLRACLDRLRYVEKQHSADENNDAIYGLRTSLCALERRAARIHGRNTNIEASVAEFGPFCSRCGHVGHQCKESNDAK